MFRCVRLSGVWYCIEVDLGDDIENIKELVDDGDVVVLAQNEDDFRETVSFDEYIDEVRWVEAE